MILEDEVGFLATYRCPVKFSYYRRLLVNRPRILDIGCGNGSPTLTKLWFPDCFYVGADIQRYNNTDADLAAIDQFFLISGEGSYDEIPDNSFDLIIMAHVVEHMDNPYKIVERACKKLKVNGIIWIAFPSLRSLSLPSARGTLQFCDDPTHVRVIDLAALCNVLLNQGVKIVHAGRTRDLLRYTTGMLRFPFAVLSRIARGKMKAGGLWVFLGFEDHIFGIRRE